jgi:hypothetical protein
MGFFVSIDGGWAPRHIHATIEQAITEARRLSEAPTLSNRTIRILQETMTLIPHYMGIHGEKYLVINNPSVPINVGYALDLMRARLVK